MMNSKWYLGLFLLFLIISTLVLITEGNFLGEGQTGVLYRVTQLGWGSPGAFFELVGSVATWNFAFFKDGIGVWIRPILLALSAAILIPLAFETFRLLRSLLPF